MSERSTSELRPAPMLGNIYYLYNAHKADSLCKVDDVVGTTVFVVKLRMLVLSVQCKRIKREGGEMFH